MPDQRTTDDIERACEVMHDAYERAAVGAGWETQAASRRPWADVPEANRATMRAAVAALFDHLDVESLRARLAAAEAEKKHMRDVYRNANAGQVLRAEAAEARVAVLEGNIEAVRDLRADVEEDGDAPVGWLLSRIAAALAGVGSTPNPSDEPDLTTRYLDLLDSITPDPEGKARIAAVRGSHDVPARCVHGRMRPHIHDDGILPPLACPGPAVVPATTEEQK